MPHTKARRVLDRMNRIIRIDRMKGRISYPVDPVNPVERKRG
jgi:hypothetical protein